MGRFFSFNKDKESEVGEEGQQEGLLGQDKDKGKQQTSSSWSLPWSKSKEPEEVGSAFCVTGPTDDGLFSVVGRKGRWGHVISGEWKQ